MLEKEVFFSEMDKLVNMYPNWGLKYDDKKVMKQWYEKFRHMDNERFSYMINQYIKHERAYPTIAGLLENDTIPRKSRDQIEHEKMLKEMGLYQ